METLARLDQRRRTVMVKLDRGYDDFVSGKISEEFWTRKSQGRPKSKSWTVSVRV